MKHYGKIQSDSPDTSEPIKVRGNVILIDFEEHSCIRDSMGNDAVDAVKRFLSQFPYSRDYLFQRLNNLQ